MTYRNRNTRGLRNQQLDAKRRRRLAEDAEIAARLARLQSSGMLEDGDGPEAVDAPTLPALPRSDGLSGLRVWCKHCNAWHHHGEGYGHRVAHCHDASSPYVDTGYVLGPP